MIPFVDLGAQQQRLRPELDAAIERVLDHGQFILGPEVEELELALSDRLGVRETVTCASGTEALALGLRALGIGSGDAVIVPAFTFVATASAVALVGAVPVFADVDPVTFNIDADSAARALDAAASSGLQARAIVAVDLFGLPADTEALEVLTSSRGIELVIDAAQSLGASIDGRPVGTFGRFAATSFFPAKPLGCYGDGGAVFTNDQELAATLRSLRVHGQGADKYDNVRLGTTGRLDTIQAAVLLVKLRVFDEELRAREEAARTYAAALRDLVAVPTVPAGWTSSWAAYTVKARQRDAVVDFLKQAGIPSMVYYRRALHQQPVFAGGIADPAGLPVAEALANEVVSIPIHPYLGGDQERVIDALAAAVAETGGR